MKEEKEVTQLTIEDISAVEERTLLDDLVEIDATNTEVDIDKYYKEIESFRFQHEDLKKHEADTILEELGAKYIDISHKAKLDAAKNNLYSWIKKYDVESDLVKKADSAERDKIYGIVQFMKNYYLNTIENLMFAFEITEEEFKFLKKALTEEMKFNGIEAFNIIELYTNYITQWEGMHRELRSGFVAPIDIKNIVMLYHFLSKHEVKGLKDSFKIFISILGKIGDMNKVYSAFNIIKERINTDFLVWAGAISSDYVEETDTQVKETNPAEQQANPLAKLEKTIETLTQAVNKLTENKE